MKTAAGYVRVSSPGQATEQKTSPENQESEIRKYAKNNDLRIVEIYKDLGVSGKTSERPQLQQLLQDAESKRFEVVVVHRLSRFGRNARDLLNHYAKLKEAGVSLCSIKEGIDFSSHTGKLVLTILAAIDELEREIIVETTLENKIRKAMNGVPVGPKPYGRIFDRETGTWSLDEKKAKLIQKAADEFLSKKKKLPLSKVAQKIGMSMQQLHTIFHKSCGSKWEVKFKDLDDPIVLEIPALLDDKTIEKIKRRFDDNKTVFHGKRVHKYLLAHLIFCSHCGEPLSGMTDKKWGYQYYRHKAKCPKGGSFTVINAHPLEEVVMERVFEVFGDSEAREKALNLANTGSDETRKLESQLKSAEKALRKIEKQKENLIKAVADGQLPKGGIKKQWDALIKSEEEAQADIVTAKSELSGLVTSQDIVDAIEWDT